MVGSGSIYLPTVSHIGQSGDVAGLPIQENHGASAFEEQGFVEAVAARIEAPQKGSTRSVYEAVAARIEAPQKGSTRSVYEEQGFAEAVAARIEAPQKGSTRSVYEVKWTIVTSGASLIRWTSGYPVKSVADFLMYLMRTGRYNPAPLMVTVQPLLINWEIYPLTSARTKISLVSWIVSTETDPKAGGAYPPGTSHWPCTS